MESARFVCFSAFRSGGLRALVFRPSSHAFSGFVIVASFSSRPAAARAIRGFFQ